MNTMKAVVGVVESMVEGYTSIYLNISVDEMAKTVLKMIDKNYQVITCGRNIKDWNESKEKNPCLDEADFIKTDLCNKRQLERLFSKIKKKYGRLDAAVNNAAVQILAKGQLRGRK